MVRVAPAATVRAPVLMSPLSQFRTALLATVSGAFNVVKESLGVPCSGFTPVHWLSAREPVGVSSVPLVVKTHPIVVAPPAPPVFWKVPALMKVFVPAWLDRLLSAADCHNPAL